MHWLQRTVLLLGAGLLVTGVALWSIPAACVAAGALLVLGTVASLDVDATGGEDE